MDELSIRQLIHDLQERRWTDASLAEELGVQPVTVWRWRQPETDKNHRKAHPSKLVRRALMELIARP